MQKRAQLLPVVLMLQGVPGVQLLPVVLMLLGVLGMLGVLSGAE